MILCTSLFSQTPEETAQKAYLANINSLLIFTSESGLSSGYYRFTNSGFNMRTYSLPFRYHYNNFDEKMNIFIDGGVAYSITRLDTKTVKKTAGGDIQLTHDNKLQTYTAGIGGGLRYKSENGICFLGSFGVIYSRVGTSVRPKDDVGGAIEDFFDSNYNDNISYRLFIEANYEKYFNAYRLYSKAVFKSYETKADFNLDVLSGFKTQSDVSSIVLGTETPSFLKYEQNYISLEGYVKFNYLHGDIVDVVQFNRYLNMGVIAYWNTPETPSWANRFYTEISTVRAEGLEGHNIGVGFSIDY
jgi:hypothetical protein